MKRDTKYVIISILLFLLISLLYFFFHVVIMEFYMQDIVKEIDDVLEKQGIIHLNGSYFVDYLYNSDMVYKPFVVKYIGENEKMANEKTILKELQKNVYAIKREKEILRYVFTITDTNKESYKLKTIATIDKYLFYLKIFINILVVLVWLIIGIIYYRENLQKFLPVIGIKVYNKR